MAVQDEYKAELDRFNLLTSQRDDLLEQRYVIMNNWDKFCFQINKNVKQTLKYY